jgi:hypothetical protein
MITKLKQAVARSEKLLEWSHNVKVKAGWVCVECGELDVELLESHHIKPKAQYPALALDIDNGKCVCMPCHAAEHKNNSYIANMILARLAKVLWNRTHPDRQI